MAKPDGDDVQALPQEEENKTEKSYLTYDVTPGLVTTLGGNTKLVKPTC